MPIESVELIEFREESTASEWGNHAIRRDERQDRLAAALESIGSSIYGYAVEDDSPAARFTRRVTDPRVEGDFECIDCELFRILPYEWEDKRLMSLPNLIFKPWHYEVTWYKYALRCATGNADVSLDGWVVICDTIEEWGRAVREGREIPQVEERDVRTEADKCAEVWFARHKKLLNKYDALWSDATEFVQALCPEYASRDPERALEKLKESIGWDDDWDGVPVMPGASEKEPPPELP